MPLGLPWSASFPSLPTSPSSPLSRHTQLPERLLLHHSVPGSEPAQGFPLPAGKGPRPSILWPSPPVAAAFPQPAPLSPASLSCQPPSALVQGLKCHQLMGRKGLSCSLTSGRTRSLSIKCG